MKINSLNNWLVVGVFGVMLILPGVQMLTRVVPEPEIEENRKLMTMPTWGVRIKDWSKQFESYFNDNFGFRNLLVSWNGKLGADVIGVSNVPAVLVGKEGWLYFKAEEAQEGYKFQTYTLQDYEGKVPFTLKELTELNKRWKEISQRLKEKNIELVLVIVPDKQTIYPEYLKGVYPGKGLTRREQIYQELAKNSDIDLVDLKPGLIKMKPIAPVFYKTEYHWNPVGSWVAFREIIEKLRQKHVDWSQIRWEDFAMQQTNSVGKSLAKLMSAEVKFDDMDVKVTNTKQISEDKTQGVKVLVLHDSYFDDQFEWGTNRWLKEYFEQIKVQHHYWKDFAWDVIEKEQPQILIYEVAERMEESLLRPGD